MTIRELYSLIGGNYDQAVRVLRSDKLIDRYVRKLKNSGVGEGLAEASRTMNATGLFENAHAMKGVCANLGLDTLASAADEITEEFRPGNARKLSDAEVAKKLDNIAQMYQRALDGISRYEAEA